MDASHNLRGGKKESGSPSLGHSHARSRFSMLGLDRQLFVHQFRKVCDRWSVIRIGAGIDEVFKTYFGEQRPT